jgi:hypothetical protein
VQQPTIQAPKTAGDPYVVATPTTATELRLLRQRRGEISDQIQNVSSRREDIAEQLNDAHPAARPGLQDRLRVLDDRIVQLEKELDVTGLALRNAPAALIASTQAPDPNIFANKIIDDVVPIVAILSVFVFAPMALAASRFIWRKAGSPQKNPAVDQASQARLDQLQAAVDTIAIEVERISEGQRFVTKLLSEKSGAVGPGPAEPARVARKSSAPAER